MFEPNRSSSCPSWPAALLVSLAWACARQAPAPVGSPGFVERRGGSVILDRRLEDAVEVGRPRVCRGEDGRARLALPLRGIGPERVVVEVQVEFLDEGGRAIGDSTTRRVVRIPPYQRTVVRAVSTRSSARRALARIWRAGTR